MEVLLKIGSFVPFGLICLLLYFLYRKIEKLIKKIEKDTLK